jgi:hypothetical protein
MTEQEATRADRWAHYRGPATTKGRIRRSLNSGALALRLIGPPSSFGLFESGNALVGLGQIFPQPLGAITPVTERRDCDDGDTPATPKKAQAFFPAALSDLNLRCSARMCSCVAP